MAGRGRKFLDSLQKAKADSSRDESQAGQPSSAPPPAAVAATPPVPGGRGRGRGIVQAISSLATSREQSPPREPSTSSSSGQPSPSGAIGSPPHEEMESLTLGEEQGQERRIVPQQPPEIKNKLRGTDGQQIGLCLNYVKLIQKEGTGVFEYHIYFRPQIDSRPLRAKILRQPEVSNKIGSVYQFTGMNLFLPRQLPDMIIDTTNPADDSAIQVEIQFVKIPPFAELIPFYNTMFRKIMRELKLVQINRHYYDPTSKIDVPQHKLEIWPGYVTSVLDLDDGLLLSCDASHRLLRTSTAKEILKDLFQLPDGKSRFKENALKRLVGTIVLTRYNNRPYKVDDIDFNSNPMSTFNHNGKDVTYVEYFKSSWNIDIQDLRQPLLVNRPKPPKGQTVCHHFATLP